MTLMYVALGICALVILGLLGALFFFVPMAMAGGVAWLMRAKGDVQHFRTVVLQAYKNVSERKLPLATKFLAALQTDDPEEMFGNILTVAHIAADASELDKEIEMIVETQLPIQMNNPMQRQKLITIFNAALAHTQSANDSASRSLGTGSVGPNGLNSQQGGDPSPGVATAASPVTLHVYTNGTVPTTATAAPLSTGNKVAPAAAPALAGAAG